MRQGNVAGTLNAKPMTVATPAARWPRSNANGISESVSIASRPPAAIAANRSPVTSELAEASR